MSTKHDARPVVHFKLPPKTAEALDELCKADRRSRQETVEILLEWALRRIDGVAEFRSCVSEIAPMTEPNNG